MRRRLIVGLVVVAAAVGAARWLPAPSSDSDTASAAAGETQKPVQEPKSDERFSALPQRAPLAEPRGALFATPPSPPKPKPKPAAPVVEAKPTPPPMPYRVAGRLAHNGESKLVLIRGDRVLTVEEGDKLEGGYRVDAIGNDEITLVYEPLGVRERLTLAAAAANATPGSAPAAAGGSQSAQLRWEGPARVQAGATFNLVLKVNSNEPLRASPMQVTYDANLLEAVSVRPGRFFASDANFSYRINPGGTIVVGAASAASNPATDAELVVLTFKPTRPAAAAEIKLAALQLQGGVGRPIAAEPLSPFRTAITP